MDEGFIYMVTPNNKLTRVDKVTIPHLEKRKEQLEDELEKIPEAIKKTTSKEDITRLQSAKVLANSEWKYVTSYLSILQKLKSVESCDKSGDDDEYDYEKEDMILDQISKEMTLLKEAEMEIRQFTDKYGHVAGNVSKEAGTEKNNMEFVEDVRSHVRI